MSIFLIASGTLIALGIFVLGPLAKKESNERKRANELRKKDETRE